MSMKIKYIALCLLLALVGCQRDKEMEMAWVKVSNEVIEPRYKSVRISSTISSNATINHVVVILSTTPKFSSTTHYTMEKQPDGKYSVAIANLTHSTTYYVRYQGSNQWSSLQPTTISEFRTTDTPSIAVVTTSQVTDISYYSATIGGNITDDGGAEVTERGVCYSINSNPTTANTKITSSSGLGQYTCNLTDLQDGTTYYARAYAINAKGTAYGEEVSFTTIKIGDPLTFTVNGVSFTMIAVEGGTFTMGATAEQGSDADSNETPAHQVTLSDYMIGETEVTQELWKTVMGTNPSYFKGTNLPVEDVSWEDCQNFIAELNAMTGKKFRLPTEAEWEFAARGGNKSNGFKYSGSGSIDKVAWYDGNSSNKTHPVKQKQANELGIYDMSGNVYEWCQDWYGSYSSSAQTNPTGSSSGSYRVGRGGSWYSYATFCRVSFRNYSAPANANYYLGLRLAL